MNVYGLVILLANESLSTLLYKDTLIRTSTFLRSLRSLVDNSLPLVVSILCSTIWKSVVFKG